MSRESFEIMAPAGSFESLRAAIQGGAGSVYFGAGSLNMRSRSSANFSTSDLRELSLLCQDHGVKSYLTLNITLYDEDLEEMRRLVDAALEYNLSAVIASDQAAIMCARQNGVEVHLSTQLNISNFQSLKFYSQYADVVVLARELNMDQVKAIYQKIASDNVTGPSGNLVRVEMFAHGALCMAISGKCYISLHQLNYSANRGACLQPCRRGYDVKDRDTGQELLVDNQYIMSPKDLKTIHFLNKLVDSGVRVFKIEGRARGPEYVKVVTKCYSEAIDSILDGSYCDQKIEEWERRLAKVFNRGFWDGYYLGQKIGEWSHQYGSMAQEKKVYVGKCLNYFSRLGVGEFVLETSNLALGDKILITGPTTGALDMTVLTLRTNLVEVAAVNKGDRFSMAVNEPIRRSDKLFKIVEARDVKGQ